MSKSSRFSLIAAYAKSNRGIGYKNDLVWKFKEDMEFFRKTTILTGVDNDTSDVGYPNKVIMGRNTWESIPKKFKPLPDRTNVVLSESMSEGKHRYDSDKNKLVNEYYDSQYDKYKQHLYNVRLANSLDDALSNGKGHSFVIGGAQLYDQAIRDPRCETLYLTEVDDTDKDYKFDTYFPEIPKRFKLVESVQGS